MVSGPRRARRGRLRDGANLGLRFLSDQDPAVREAVACLVFSDSGLWDKTRRSALAGRGLLSGLGFVFWRAATTIPRTSLDMIRLFRIVPAVKGRGGDDGIRPADPGLRAGS
ncbi:hypothetical protein [Rhodobacter sp. NSM]|uniref:hypothetical protein n=1 Tax=Rhodobacter sp. NSM TaxID=3457501 RepID=UPI003FD60F11